MGIEIENNGKNVLVLISCITSGRTVARAMESVQYYGGRVAGVSAIFSATDTIEGVHVDSIFGGCPVAT